MELTRSGHQSRCLVLNAHKLDYGDADHVRLLLEVKVDDSVTSANASVSIGLIVTELVTTPSSTRSAAVGAAP